MNSSDYFLINTNFSQIQIVTCALSDDVLIPSYHKSINYKTCTHFLPPTKTEPIAANRIGVLSLKKNTFKIANKRVTINETSPRMLVALTA